MQRLRAPMPHATLRDLRKAYEQFQRNQDIKSVIGFVLSTDVVSLDSTSPGSDLQPTLSRDDLRLICFEYVWS